MKSNTEWSVASGQWSENTRRKSTKIDLNRFTSKTLAGITASVFVLAAAPLFAVPLAEIEVRQSGGDGVLDRAFVLAQVASVVGEEVSPEGMANDVRTLLDTGHFSMVEGMAEEVPGGVRFIYAVAPRVRVGDRVSVEGNHYFSRKSKIRDFANLAPGSFVDEQLLGAAAARIEAGYRERRYYDVKVSCVATLIEETPGVALVHIAIDEGVRYSVPLVSFSGNKVLGDGELRRHTGQAPWWNPAGWVSTKRLGDFDLQLVRADARKQYRDLGYLDADIFGPYIEVVGDVRRIEFMVMEGTRYRVGEVAVTGARLFPVETLIRVSGLRRGAIATVDNAAKAIRDYYGARGYVDTVVRPILTVDEQDAGVMDVTFAVQEGTLTYVRNILVRGNTRTKDKVIRREIMMDPGTVFNDVLAERSERRLENLGYFENVRRYTVEAEDQGWQDIVFEVDERRTGQFQIGAGFSSVDKLVGYMELSQGNFDLYNLGRGGWTGGGQKARLYMEVSRYSNDYELSWVEPWLMDRPIALNVDLFWRNRDYDEYSERNVGTEIGLSRHVPLVGRVGLSYGIQKVDLRHIREGEYLTITGNRPYAFTREPHDYWLGSLRLDWVYETVDNRLIPTRGTRAVASVTGYAKALGSSTDFYELGGMVRHYIPTFRRHVLGLYLRGAVVDSVGSDPVPISNRYFLGGNRNVRGFGYRSISPKVYPAGDAYAHRYNYRPIGGKTLAQGSVEYSIPIVGYLRLGAFYDFGNVWADAYKFGGTLASSVGGGIRFDIPGFPLRFDYAYPLSRSDSYAREQRWVFWVGFD
ncbi:MAG: outer membrane protein assembly factor BamA [Kiritimatiellaeota bacterium]|nr:outer membrane protein assembly factor BamA [Kiritimatiellota bacterium]